MILFTRNILNKYSIESRAAECYITYDSYKHIGLRPNDTHYECVIITCEKQNRFHIMLTMAVRRDSILLL